MARPWFRMYRKIVGSRKLHDLKPELFKSWVLILATTHDDGSLPPLDDVAFALRLSVQKATEIIDKLIAADMLDRDGETVTAHDWDEHQFDSDTDPTARDRKRKQREKERDVTRDATVTERDSHDDGHANVTRTDTDTDTDTDKRQKQNPVASATADDPVFPDDMDLKLAFDHWNETVPNFGLSPVRDRGPERRQKLKARLKEAGSLAQFCLLVNSLQNRPFCLGEGPRKNGAAPWKIDIEYVLTKAGFRKLSEGAWLKDGTTMIEAEFHASH